MQNQLKAYQGKNIAIELTNGRQLFGTLLELNDKIIRVETDRGVATLLVDSIHIIWENQKRSLTEKDLEQIAEAVEDLKVQYVCPSSFSCPGGGYTCLPPHDCPVFTCQAGNFSLAGCNPSNGCYPSSGCNPSIGCYPSSGCNPSSGCYPSSGCNPSIGCYPSSGCNPSIGCYPSSGCNPSSGCSPSSPCSFSFVGKVKPRTQPTKKDEQNDNDHKETKE
jgi:hypothetical protein